ncbi:UNVERIFIED_CONTAM: hypothetical protein GTU68_066058, partial [Idotea baltica]|nr:hypothetical protein [Idotea baltica]
MANTTQHGQWLQLEQWFSESELRAVSYDQVRYAIDQKTKPLGALGQIEIIAAHLALLQDTLTPSIATSRTIVFGADHGIADEGVSAFPADVTAQMMANFAAGGAAVCVLSAANDVQVEVVDVGVNNDLSALTEIVHAKVATGTHNFAKLAAMNPDELVKSVEVGREAIRRAILDKVDCIGLGEMGIANTSSASAIIAMLLSLPASDITGRGTGIDDVALQHKCKVIQSAIELHQTHC